MRDERVDLDLVRRKYRLERDRRIHIDGIGQYDKYEPLASANQEQTRSGAIHTADSGVFDAIIVGGGIAGILAGVRLTQAGLQRVRILEKADGLGGTWHQNRYPGVRCDIESYIYLPLLEETGYMPSEKYVSGREIRDHLLSVAQTFGLTDHLMLNCRVDGLTWIEANSHWEVSTNSGLMLAKFVVHAGGLFTEPKIPQISGAGLFAGRIFHTSRWDHEYTGQDLSRMSDKRVAVIGTGATAVQCIPPLAEKSKSLHVFQRTPSSVATRANRPTDHNWARDLSSGWQRERMVNFTEIVSLHTSESDLVDDGWTRMMRRVGSYFATDRTLPETELGSLLEEQDFYYMEEIRERIDRIVVDAKKAAILKPYYRVLCKRPCFSDDYLQAFNRSNVTLVDVSGDNRIDQVARDGLVVAGRLVELDCIIFATGFRIGTSIVDRCGFDIVGVSGEKLSEKWKFGPITLHGCMSNGYPNLFFLGAIQTGATSNFTHLLYEQTEHVAAIIQESRRREEVQVEPTAEAEGRWVATVRESSRGNIDFLRDCTPGYFNQEGRPEDPNGLISAQYGGGPLPFFDMLARWRESDFAKDLIFGATPGDQWRPKR